MDSEVESMVDSTVEWVEVDSGRTWSGLDGGVGGLRSGINGGLHSGVGGGGLRGGLGVELGG